LTGNPRKSSVFPLFLLQAFPISSKRERREFDASGESLAADTGRTLSKATAGDYVSGTYGQRLTPASGRFDMIENFLGFQLVPWTPSIDKHLGRHISGVMRGD
jgi:hypothetical protein